MVLTDSRVLFSTKKKWAIKSWKDVKKTNVFYHQVKDSLEKVLKCMVPTIWYSGKGKTMYAVKR